MSYRRFQSSLYQDFRINCLCRILLIVITISLLVILCFQTRLYATSILILCLILFQIMNLLNFVDKSNQLMSRAFESILYENFSERMEMFCQDTASKELCNKLNEIVSKFQRNRLEKEQHFYYLQAVIRQSGIGLISVKSNGEVNLSNKIALKILQLPRLQHIQQLEHVEQTGTGEQTNDIDHSLNRHFVHTLKQMRSGEKCYCNIGSKNNSVQVLVYLKTIRLHGEEYRLFTLQNIQNALEEKEMDAWKDLIHVLSHEIMNSVTPISSLAATANLLLGDGDDISSTDIIDLRQAMQTIEKRSRGLIQFVETYRRFARIPEPQREIVYIMALFRQIENLIRPVLEQDARESGRDTVAFRTTTIPEALQLNIDPDLIEQVLLNLLQNAVEAVKGTPTPTISLRATVNEKSIPVIQVKDNGSGIPDEVLPRIFIPFFTTRPDGSGIGLSLCRQIMHLHRGSIQVKSEPKAQTVFSLIFSDQGIVQTSKKI